MTLSADSPSSSGSSRAKIPESPTLGAALKIVRHFRETMKTATLSLACLLPLLVTAVPTACARAPIGAGERPDARASDTTEARALFESNIDAIHKRDRARYLATYLHSSTLGRNGPAGLELGYENWSARNDSSWPDTLIARNLRVLPISAGVVYGSYCYTVTQHDSTSSGVSERIFVKTQEGWKIAVTTAFGLAPGAQAQCK